ncbi:hypothetical protein [Sporosarcina sp. SAFN-010]|uniref:hypothetical protein n=1 Tax=Sporosarcina sp. SAFN-010 TaxID=3387273 RepID=UPI003F804D24
MLFAQILRKKAHWIFEADRQPQFAPDIVLVDITDKPEVQEGWDYDHTTGFFTEPVPTEAPFPELTEIELLQQENLLLKAQKQALTERAEFIEDVVAEMAAQVYQ